MTTREDVINAIRQIEKAGYAGEATRTAQLELLMLPAPDLDRMLKRLRMACPQLFPTFSGAPAKPPPGAPPEQQGVAAQAMRRAEAALAQQQTVVADFDRQVIAALLSAHKTTTEGRALLDDLETQIDCAARSWDLTTTAGAREFQRFLISKLDSVIRVVEEANDDNNSKRSLAAAWAALYAAQGGPGESTTTKQDDSSSRNDAAAQDVSDISTDPYLSAFSPHEPEPAGPGAASGTSMPASMIPAIPGLGAMAPSGGSVPAGGIPAGLSPASLERALSPARFRDQPLEFDDEQTAAPDTPADEPEEEGSDPVGGPVGADPTTVRLPDGETVTVGTPRIAAVLRAAAGGTPVAEAFRQQGITIPPPGSAISSPVDAARVGPGDIGMFTDRHALALGNSKALLDGQIQQIGNVSGPSFLGWQHPPIDGETDAAIPAPTRLSAMLRA